MKNSEKTAKQSKKGAGRAKSDLPAAKKTARSAALELLCRIDGGGYSNILIDSLMRDSALTDADRALAAYLVRGVTERRLTVDYVIARISSRPPSKIDTKTKNILRLGIFQLAFSDRIPPHAAVNETVGLAAHEARGFVNAVLRNFQRTMSEGELPMPARRGKGIKYLSIRYSVCESLCRELVAAYGTARTEAMLGAFLMPPPLTLRTNTTRADRDALCRELTREGFDAVPTAASPWGVRVSGSGLPACLTGDTPTVFAEDEAAQLAVWVLGARPGERVLDACAAPGTKSISAALEMQNSGTVVACELHESRAGLIEKSAARQGVSIIHAVCRDSTVRYGEDEEFDRVLCDVPCSGYGALRRKPEIRYREVEASAELPALQGAILAASAESLKCGGVLVYSTCTVLPRENEDVISAFLAAHTDFERVPFTLPDGTEAPDGMITLTPDMPLGSDGFFICKLIRRGQKTDLMVQNRA